MRFRLGTHTPQFYLPPSLLFTYQRPRCCIVLVRCQQSCRRRLNTSEWTMEIPQELARSCRFLSENPGRRYRVTNSGPWRCTRPPGSEESACSLRYRQAKVTKCGGRGGRKSSRLDSTHEAGEPPPREPVEGSEASDYGTAFEKHDEGIELR